MLVLRMRWAFAVLLFLVLFVSSGRSLKCMQCTSFSTTPCTGDLQDCSSPSDVCGTTVIRTRGNRWTSFYYIRSCVSPVECLNNASVTGLYATTASETTCCIDSNCTPSVPTLPVENYTLNGLICPAYVVTRMEPCDIKNLSVCTGDQVRCVRYSAKTTIGSTSSTLFLGGCATVDTCALESSSIYGDGISVEINRKCYNSAGGIYSRAMSYTLPMILVLFRFLFSM